MIVGHVRDGFPRITLALPGLNGLLQVEFVLDTGFEGELTLPENLLREIDADFVATQTMLMADDSERRTRHFQIVLEWNEEARFTEVIALEGRPLLGNLLLEGCGVQIEMTDGGEVVVEFK